MYQVKQVAALTGLTPATLRVWERRYGVVAPVRSTGGYRLYDEAGVQRLIVMKALVDAGTAPALAARQVDSGALVARDAEHRADGGPSGVPAALADDVQALAREARRMSAASLSAVLDDAFARDRLAAVVDGWLLPALVALGEAWHRGEVSVAGEHFVSAAVARRLGRAFEDAVVAPGAPQVLVGLPRGARHEIGAAAFAALLRERGVDVTYLGADVPTESWVATATARTPAAVVLVVPTSDDVLAGREVVRAVSAAGGATVYAGGGQQSLLGTPAVPLGPTVTAAIDRLTADLHLTVSRPYAGDPATGHPA